MRAMCLLLYLCVLEHVNGSTAAMVISGKLKVWRLLIYDNMFTLIHQGRLLDGAKILQNPVK